MRVGDLYFSQRNALNVLRADSNGGLCAHNYEHLGSAKNN